MKRHHLALFSSLMFTFVGINAPASTLYVDVNSANATPPYADWSTAATNIQDAIDASSTGDVIWVTNGVYATGGKVMAGDLTNRVTLYKPVTVQSVNGPFLTVIQGAGNTNGINAVRGAWLTNGATLQGFTLQYGATRNSGDAATLASGGGVWCYSNAIVANCVIRSNSAASQGAGAYLGTIFNSFFTRNGSGQSTVYNASLINCTIVSNTIPGTSQGRMTNCLVYFNTPLNFSGGTFVKSCSTPAPLGTGNINANPQLLPDNLHLGAASPCRAAGTNVTAGTDIDGDPWSNPPSIGCDEWLPLPQIIAQPTYQLLSNSLGFNISLTLNGQEPFSIWWTHDGVLLEDDGHYSGTHTTTLTAGGISQLDLGNYQVVISNAFGVVTSAVARVAGHFVDAAGNNPIPPYLDWAAAATNLQDAIDAALPGEIVLVTNGVYASGGKVMSGDLTNRVAIDKALAVQSVNGPKFTTIQGAWDPATNGPAAVRCAWLTNGAILSGFTIMGGATRGGGSALLVDGGGVWGSSSNTLVFNCVVAGNAAYDQGGGAYRVTLDHCTLQGNRATPSSSQGGGGGALSCVLKNCLIMENVAVAGSGGGVKGCGVWNSALLRNSSRLDGTAAYQSTLFNCTVTGNIVPGSATIYAAVYGSILTNSIVWGSVNQDGAPTPNQEGCSMLYCCTTPLPGGTGNISPDPQLTGNGFHLAETSPCRGAGTTNGVSGRDIDGQPWHQPPDIGCDSWQAGASVDAGPGFKPGPEPGSLIFTLIPLGQSPFQLFWYKDDVLLQEDPHYGPLGMANLMVHHLGPEDAGDYRVVVSNAFGVVTSSVTRVVIHCVDAAGGNPTTPYTNWVTAAASIQDAIDAAQAGEIVLVTNGVYASGGKAMADDSVNRVALDKALLLQSLNGAQATVIQGAWDSATNGPAAVRCAWLTNGAVLSGFTLVGGATRATESSSSYGGGVWGSSSNATLVVNCLLATNAATSGAGAYQVTLDHCTLVGNQASGSANAGSGGGAMNCQLKNCILTGNVVTFGQGGGVHGSTLWNCALTRNSANVYGGAASSSILFNCTVTANTSSGYSSGYGAAVYGGALTNCIVWGNFQRTSYPYTNYANCTLSYCCADPLAPGNGNIAVDPRLLGDGIHLDLSSPCRAAGTNSVVSGFDIEDQPWSNPPDIGCDSWQPAPLAAGSPAYKTGPNSRWLTLTVTPIGQPPFTCYWMKDGVVLQAGPHYGPLGLTNLLVNGFGPEDAGAYQVMLSNAFGVVTSQVTRVVIHCVDAAGVNPTPPYAGWSTAATSIQDAIDAAQPGEIVLVTNGVYATGGKAMTGDLTNRVALDKPLTVASVNGYTATTIQGAWDPGSTNGPLAVRCAWLTNGATLNGFTLQNGATRGGNPVNQDLQFGGGVWCASTNPIVANCLLTNNCALYGGGGASLGTFNNCLVMGNQAQYGGGAHSAILNNCTVINNRGAFPAVLGGAGAYGGIARNSIVINNYDFISENNYPPSPAPQYSYSLTYPAVSGAGNLNLGNLEPQFLDRFHISATSPLRHAGSALYATGTDIDGEPWNNPPSIGCDEVIDAAFTGPLSVSIEATLGTNSVADTFTGILEFIGSYTGNASRLEWSLGDEPVLTNENYYIWHIWTNAGDYVVTFTAYNLDHPEGVSTNLAVHIDPKLPPVVQTAGLTPNGFQFSFYGQQSVPYQVQYATNLAPPIVWQTLQSIYPHTNGPVQVMDSAVTNAARFYRVVAGF